MEKSDIPRICEDHFSPDSFETTEDIEAHKTLMPDAIPTLKLKLEKGPFEESDSKDTSDNANVDQEAETNENTNEKDVSNVESNVSKEGSEKKKCCIPRCNSPGDVLFKFPEGM